MRKARAAPHRDAAAPAAVAEVGPIFDAAVMDRDDVLESVSGHISQANALVGEVYIRKVVERLAFDDYCPLPRLVEDPDH